MRRLFHVLLAAGIALAGCTFAGLVDYDVPGCDPGLPLEQDPCNRLNTGNGSCTRYQCSAVTRTCARQTLDEDRDGDPAFACGGTDCDDREPRRSGKATEICDEVDNDCDGVVDDGLLGPATPAVQIAALADQRVGNADVRLASTNGVDTYATYLGQRAGCVRGVLLGDQETDAGCMTVAEGDAGASVRQPDLGPVGILRESTTGIAFVRGPGGDCAKDRLAYWSRATGRTVLADCGAALPALASFPLQPEAVVAYYDARIADRDEPAKQCATMAPAALKLRWIDQPTTVADTVASAASSLGLARAMRPPALLSVAGGTAVLLASPLDASAALWSLTPDGRIIPLAPSIAFLADARSVAMAMGTDGTRTRLAIVAEQGCRPSQTLRMVLAKLDPVSASLDDLAKPFNEVAVVADPVSAVTAPAVVWIGERKEWWVTWVDERNKAMLRRVGVDGSLPEAAVEIGDAALAMATAARAVPALPPGILVVRPNGMVVDRVSLVCKP